MPENETQFGNQDLQELVECAGRALKSEERYLTACALAHGWVHGWVGIRANVNEHYLQSVIWRALMSSFPWRPEVESAGRHDLAFYDGESSKLVAIAELKGWWSRDGKSEIPGMLKNISDLATKNVPGVMLIVTQHAKGEKAKENLKVLANELGVDQDKFVTYAFDTYPVPDDDRPQEFAVIGFLVPGKALPPSALT